MLLWAACWAHHLQVVCRVEACMAVVVLALCSTRLLCNLLVPTALSLRLQQRARAAVVVLRRRQQQQPRMVLLAWQQV